MLTIAVLFFIKPASAVDINIKARPLYGSNGSIATDSVATVYDDVLVSSSGWSVRNIRNIVSLKLDEYSGKILPDSFKITVIYELSYKVWPSTTLQTKNDTLSVTYYKNKAFGKASMSVNPGVYYSSAKIISVTAQYATIETFIGSVMLENEIQSSRDYSAFDCNNNAIQTLSQDTQYIESKRELSVSWPAVLEADEYDLEWAVIDESAIADYYKYNTSIIDPEKIFDNNATRVTLNAEKIEYKIPLLYERGKRVYVRIRSVQVLTRGLRKEANWSSDYSGGLQDYYIWDGLEPTIDWQATTSYAEEGKRKSVVQFYDGSLRVRQTVTKDNVTDTTIIAETLYDYEGRPQIQVLPSPSLSSLIKYTPNFNSPVNGSEYYKDLYDFSSSLYCESGAPKMDTTTGASRYYSSNNPSKDNGINRFIPNAFGYPFTETKYTQDGTGRVAEQGGVGAYHQVGTVADGPLAEGHQTKYYYGTADQEDLDALFGTEAGEASHYFKNMVRDANGQFSVSYVDMHGRTIATALAGTPSTTKLDKISSNISRYETKNLLSGGANVKTDKYTIESRKSLVVTKASYHSFNYSLLGDSLTIKDCQELNICYDCLYDLEISITDDCNNQKLPGDTGLVFRQSNFNLTEFLSNPDTSCNALTNLSWTKNIFLEEGVYMVTKKLSVSKPAMDFYRDSVFLKHNTCKTLQQFIDSVKTAILSNISCETTCEQCADSVGTWESYHEKFMTKLGIAVADTASYRDAAWKSYNTELAICDAICTTGTDLLAEIKEGLLMDVSAPAGQYANDYLMGENERYAWSVFKKDPLNPAKLKYQLPLSDYLDEDGNSSLVDGLRPEQLSPADFAANFKDSWAKSLISKHPEYPRYLRLLKFKNSFAWDRAFESTNDYATAKSRGYLNPTNNNTSAYTVFDPAVPTNISRDPFYTICVDSFSNSSIKTSMESYMMNVGSSGMSLRIWNAATINAKCLNENDAACYATYQAAANAFKESLLCQGDLDAAWRSFRDMYLAKKTRLLYGLVLQSADAVITPAVPNPAIAGDDMAHTLRIFNADELDAGDLGNGASDGPGYQQNSGAEILAMLPDNCNSYAEQWLEDLGACGYTAEQKTILVQQLVAVCVAGGDLNHPFGASTVSPTSNFVPRSFIDVVSAFNLQNGITTSITCNGNLITVPLPYDVQSSINTGNEYISGTPDSCVCSKISSLYTNYQQTPSGYANFSAYVKYMTGADMKETDLQKLRSICTTSVNGECNNLDSVIALPPALQCGTSSCIDCDQMKVHLDAFKATYPGLSVNIPDSTDEEQDAINKLFTSFMNNRTGLNKTLYEYIAFIDTCDINTLPNAHCDSLSLILNDFKSFYYNIDFNHINGSKKLTQCAEELIGAYNALLEIQHNPANPSLPAGYCLDTDTSTHDTRLHAVRRSMDPLADSVFQMAIPLALDCNVQFGEPLTELWGNTVLPQDFCTNYASPAQLSKKYFAVAAFNSPDQLRVIWSDKDDGAYAYYSTYSPIKKYLPDSTALQNHVYGMELIKIPDTVLTSAQFSIVRPILPLIPLDSIRRLHGFGFDTRFMPANYASESDYFSAVHIKVYAEMMNGQTDTLHVRAGYEDNLYVKWKETVDTSIYNPDCKKAFTAYFNQLTGHSYTYEQILELYEDCGIFDPVCGPDKLSCTELQQTLKDYNNSLLNITHDSTGYENTWTLAPNHYSTMHDPDDYNMKDFIRTGMISVPDSVVTVPGDFGFASQLQFCIDEEYSFESRMRIKPGFDYNTAQVTLLFGNYSGPATLPRGWLQTVFTGNSTVTGFQGTYYDSVWAPVGSYSAWPDSTMHTLFDVWKNVKLTFKKSGLINCYVDNVWVGSITLPYFMTPVNFSIAGWNNNPVEVDWVKMYNSAGEVKYHEEFTNSANFEKTPYEWICSKPACETGFTSFFNEQYGTSYSYGQIAALYKSICKKDIGLCPPTPKPMLCATPDSFPAYNPPDRCELAVNGATDLGTILFNNYQDSIRNYFEDKYLSRCLNIASRETFTVSDSSSEFHYTLYYYDQAGNLVKTIPPAGVNLSKMDHKTTWSDSVKAARLAKTMLGVEHALPTLYRYNTLNQVLAQNTPDAGISRFWYDRLGRLAISQNAKQRTVNVSAEINRKYSYTLYDEIGRITEVGEYQNPGSTTMTQQLSRDVAALSSWLSTTNNRKEVIRTVYDIANPNWANIAAADVPVNAQNLRNRVSYVQYYPQGAPNGLNYGQATTYSYDIHGNVDTLIQDYGSYNYSAYRNIMNANGLHNRIKKTVYQYDLISGKVNHVAFQPQYRKGANLYIPADALYHKYEYDAENRLTAVQVSTDSITWEQDAAYNYYKHGPLARTVLGQQRVQGIDYAYTIQGWLKGINSTSLDSTKDMGNDGLPGSDLPADVLGFNLNYFNGDYSSIGAGAGVAAFPEHTEAGGIRGGVDNSEYRPLYNGNISSIALNIGKLAVPDATGTGTTEGAILYNYGYDQLNRLVKMDAYKGLTKSNNSWADIIPLPHYQERVTYDGNGNILTYKRNGNKTSQQLMDDLGYVYTYHTTGALTGKLKSNQLKQVTDAVTNTAAYDESDAASGVSDIENQAANNYAYDSIGNLIKDTKENISSINWNVYGKINDINFTFVANKVKKITYAYDAAGNRISKIVEQYGATSGATTSSTYTWYSRDASGNVMAVYSSTGSGTTLPSTVDVTERHLYGSSRLGILSETKDAKNLTTLAITTPYLSSFTRGKKIFELSNHLGNVLTTVSDRKFGVDNDSDGMVDNYLTDVVSANDYYPFGMQMPGRSFSVGNSYRYGFNGKENDNESKGMGNSLDFGARIYDPRISKFLSVDPLQKKYPSESPYIFAGNSPIGVIDIGGKYKYVVILDYDVNTGRYTLIGIRKEKGLKASTIEKKEQACSSCGSSLVYQDEWRDYITFEISAINGEGNYQFSVADIFVGNVKATTDHEGLFSGEWYALLKAKEDDVDRGGMMWTTSKKGGYQGPGIAGNPSNIENIDDWVEMTEKFEEISNYGIKSDVLDEVTAKIIEAIKQSESPLGSAGTPKPADNLDLVLQILKKMAPDDPSENSKKTQKAKEEYEDKFKVKKFNTQSKQTTKYKDSTWTGKTADGRDSSHSETIEVPVKD
ncbi:MAG: RHS repeat-associated core domain-containing protein [Ferruginibacter sp.]